jgi:hypothetical protein
LGLHKEGVIQQQVVQDITWGALLLCWFAAHCIGGVACLHACFDSPCVWGNSGIEGLGAACCKENVSGIKGSACISGKIIIYFIMRAHANTIILNLFLQLSPDVA